MVMSLGVPLMVCRYLYHNLFNLPKASSHVSDFNSLNKLLTAKLLKEGYGFHNTTKHFPNLTVGILNVLKYIMSV